MRQTGLYSKLESSCNFIARLPARRQTKYQKRAISDARPRQGHKEAFSGTNMVLELQAASVTSNVVVLVCAYVYAELTCILPFRICNVPGKED